MYTNRLPKFALLLSILMLWAFTALVPDIADASTSVQPSITQQKREITLTQLPCQMLEPEAGIDHAFNAWHGSHCRRLNRDARNRMQTMSPLVIETGTWVFTIRNKSVPWNVGFWLRAEKVGDRLLLPKVELNSKLSMGDAKSVTVNLPPGDYVFSCPFNATPLYRLTVLPIVP